MPHWRRMWWPGGTWFFQPAGAARQPAAGGADRPSASVGRQAHPFAIHAWVVLPDHLHCILSLPEGDNDFPLRWPRLKSHFSRSLPATERRSQTRLRHGELGIWQRQSWEHLIRNERDYRHHMDYVHINPLRHGYVTQVADWPYSTFHRYVANGIYPQDWCG